MQCAQLDISFPVWLDYIFLMVGVPKVKKLLHKIEIKKYLYCLYAIITMYTTQYLVTVFIFK